MSGRDSRHTVETCGKSSPLLAPAEDTRMLRACVRSASVFSERAAWSISEWNRRILALVTKSRPSRASLCLHTKAYTRSTSSLECVKSMAWSSGLARNCAERKWQTTRMRQERECGDAARLLWAASVRRFWTSATILPKSARRSEM